MLNRKNLLLAFSSGLGASGVAASLSYAALVGVGCKPKITLCLMLVFPLLEIVAFLFIRESNAIESSTIDPSSATSLIGDSTNASGTTATIDETAPMTFSEKKQYLPKLAKYFIPLSISHVCKGVMVQMVR